MPVCGPPVAPRATWAHLAVCGSRPPPRAARLAARLDVLLGCTSRLVGSHQAAAWRCALELQVCRCLGRPSAPNVKGGIARAQVAHRQHIPRTHLRLGAHKIAGFNWQGAGNAVQITARAH